MRDRLSLSKQRQFSKGEEEIANALHLAEEEEELAII